MQLHKYKHKPSVAHNNECILLMRLQAIWVVLLFWDRLSSSWLDSLTDLQSAGAWLSNVALVFCWDISYLIHLAPLIPASQPSIVPIKEAGMVYIERENSTQSLLGPRLKKGTS